MNRQTPALLATLLAAIALCVGARAADFPPLTGRIVDQANLLPADQRTALDTKLADLESKSGIQLVVATVTSLNGQEIEPYANELFRAWKLGERTKNNGVLFLVAPNERRGRVEGGHGVEGTLPHPPSKGSIPHAGAPPLQAGGFAGGPTPPARDHVTAPP